MKKIPNLWVLSTAVFAGCSSGDSPKLAEYEVRDSAGIEVIQSGPPRHTGPDGWRVIPEPVLQIGERDGESPYLFSRVRSAVRVSDGRIVVLEGESLEIRVFGPDGAHHVSFGRRGDGPLEFESWPNMALAPPDTLVVWDPGHGRLSWFDLEGSLLKQRSFLTTVAKLRALRGPFWSVRRDGSVLAISPVSGTTRDGLYDEVRRIGLIEEGGETSHDFGIFPAGERFGHPMGLIFSSWFGPFVKGALGPPPDRVLLSAPEKWEIRFFSSEGLLRRILRAPVPRIPVTTEIRTARSNDIEDIALQAGLTSGEAARIDAQMPVPDSLPAIEEMMWDQLDNLWVGRRTAELNKTEHFDVFDVTGRWLSTVHFPSDLGSIREIGEDYVLAVWWDELWVPYVRLYRLEKPGF
jgi:hypothetical protein